MKLNYKIGDYFLVPLISGRFAIGRVARHSGNGIVLSYFFSPLGKGRPTPNELEVLEPQAAITVQLHGDLAMINGRWPLIHSREELDQEKWPLPVFKHVDIIDCRIFARFYDAKLRFLGEREITPKEGAGMPDDGLSGDEAMQVTLARMIEGKP